MLRFFALLTLTVLTAAPAWADEPDTVPAAKAPDAGPGARYCLRVEPITGSRIETIQCETREQWAALEVDVDKEWATEGVRVVG